MLSLIRLFLIVCIIVCLQTMQCGQTISLLFTQLGFLCYTYIGIFKYKMNISMLDGVKTVVFETSLTIFF